MTQAGKDASPAGGAVRYERHRPETTLLYQLVDEHYPAFADRMAAQGAPLSVYVQREFEDHLRCGRLEHGFLRMMFNYVHADIENNITVREANLDAFQFRFQVLY